MPVIMLQIKPLFLHRAVGIVVSQSKLSQPGETNGSYVAYNLKKLPNLFN